MLNRDYFVKPIPIGLTMSVRSVTDGNVVEFTDQRILFYLKRESLSQANGDSLALALFQRQAGEGYAVVFERFCRQLDSEPVGFSDFPSDDRPLADRAREYFSPSGFTDLIFAVMEDYNRAQAPVDLFRRF